MTADGFDNEAADAMCLPHATQVGLVRGLPYRRFGVIGDSLSLGVGEPRPGYGALGWSDRVARALQQAHPDADYRNDAVIGATTRATIDGQLEDVIGFRPDLLHVPCGANDIVGCVFDLAAIEHDLRELYERASTTGAQLITFTLGRAYVVRRIADWTQRITGVNELTRVIAAEHGAIVVDMWDHPVNDRADLVSADRIHFSAVGQAVMASEVIRALAGRRD